MSFLECMRHQVSWHCATSGMPVDKRCGLSTGHLLPGKLHSTMVTGNSSLAGGCQAVQKLHFGICMAGGLSLPEEITVCGSRSSLSCLTSLLKRPSTALTALEAVVIQGGGSPSQPVEGALASVPGQPPTPSTPGKRLVSCGLSMMWSMLSTAGKRLYSGCSAFLQHGRQ